MQAWEACIRYTTGALMQKPLMQQSTLAASQLMRRQTVAYRWASSQAHMRSCSRGTALLHVDRLGGETCVGLWEDGVPCPYCGSLGFPGN